MEAAEELKPEVLVLGWAADGKLGQVVVGSTADRLLHSSPVPMAISTRGYRGSKVGGLARITAAYPGTPDTLHVVERVASLAERLNVPMRVVTFAVRGRTMYPPEVGLRAEDSILEQLATHARETLAQLKTDGVIGKDVALHIASWRNRQGVSRLPWLKDLAAQPRPGAGAAGLVLRGAAVDGDLAARDRRRPVTGQPRDNV
jgi:hypothetical protein